MYPNIFDSRHAPEPKPEPTKMLGCTCNIKGVRHVTPALGVWPARLVSCMGMSFMPEPMPSRELGSGYHARG
jgi:hypothetical protein